MERREVARYVGRNGRVQLDMEGYKLITISIRARAHGVELGHPWTVGRDPQEEDDGALEKRRDEMSQSPVTLLLSLPFPAFSSSPAWLTSRRSPLCTPQIPSFTAVSPGLISLPGQYVNYCCESTENQKVNDDEDDDVMMITI